MGKVITMFFNGNIPSKKDSQNLRINRKTGKRFITPSDNYKKWHTEQMFLKKAFIADRKHFLPLQPGQIELIEITITYPDKRNRDVVNTVESIQDFLVDAGVLSDDNYKVIPKLILLGLYEKDVAETRVNIYLH